MGIERLRALVLELTRIADAVPPGERAVASRPVLARLVAEDGWLPPDCARPSPERYQQYLLHCDPLERFSVVSFVWGPGQRTPVHDHLTWGLVGMLRGAERCRGWFRDADRLLPGEERLLVPGEVASVSPDDGTDIHEVANALDDRPSISIHVYGNNIGAVARHVYDRDTGAPKPFVSGYASATVPNLWDRSAELRAGALGA